jgi:hypothetical protein
MPRQRRLRDAEVTRSSEEAPLLGDGDEITKVTQFHHIPSGCGPFGRSVSSDMITFKNDALGELRPAATIDAARQSEAADPRRVRAGVLL